MRAGGDGLEQGGDGPLRIIEEAAAGFRGQLSGLPCDGDEGRS
jgi:hypothetical protein